MAIAHPDKALVGQLRYGPIMDSIDPDSVAAARDPLTGLLGRETALLRLEQWLAEGLQIHALLLGLRRFDAVNLAFGTATGDAALAAVAATLRHFAADELEGPWVLARVNGSQFMLLATEPCSRERWQFFAAQLLTALTKPIVTPGGTVRLSPRMAMLRGLTDETPPAVFERLAHTLSLLLAHSGKRLLWADGEAARGGRSLLQLDADLLGAIDRDEIEVVYQPQYACANDRLAGAEALARWNHPKLGRIGAGVLFAAAERSDHMAQLSRHIARIALEAAQRWPMDLRLSLNVTASDLSAPDFAHEFSALLDSTGYSAWRLTLEVTEQVLLGDIAHAAQGLEQLSRQGVQVALDDFGAGFCNFNYLKTLPLDYLKLDRSMLDGVVGNPRDLAVFRGIIAMARALDIKVIAEGIETEAQRLVAVSEGCDKWQGFFRAPPLSAAEFLALARG